MIEATLRCLRRAFILLYFFWSAAHAEDLQQIYDLARVHDAELRAAEAAYLAAKQDRPIARSALLPQINLQASSSRVDQDTEGTAFQNPIPLDESDRFDRDFYTLDLRQTLYNKEFFVAFRQSKSSVLQALAERDSARQALIVRTAEAYFRVLGTYDNLRFRIAEKEAIGRQLQQAKLRFEVGLIAITDVKESQASYDLAESEEILARNLIDNALEALRVITGQEHRYLNILSERMPLILPEPNDVEQWVTQALDENLDLAAARAATEVARQEVRLQRAGHYPTLDFVASRDNLDTSGGIAGSRETENTQFGVEVNVPLSTGGATQALTKQAVYNHQQAKQLEEQQRRQTVRQTRDSFFDVVAGVSRVKALSKALESSQAAAEAAEAGFDVGTRTSVDVLISLQATYRAERDYAEARYNYLLDTLRLKQATGMLSGSAIDAVNTWLDLPKPQDEPPGYDEQPTPNTLPAE